MMEDDALQDAIRNIIRIPGKLQHTPEVSFHELFLASGYVTFWREITVDLLQASLESQFPLQDDWIQLSADKRVSSGWYVVPSNDRFCVGYFDGVTCKNTKTIRNQARAVATFIKLELEDSRKHAS